LTDTTVLHRLEDLSAEWRNCHRCPLGGISFTRCILDITPADWGNEIPVDLMLIGEGPGRSEDVIGKPFCGPSGRLLRETLAEVGANSLTVAYTNLVACRPVDVAGGYDRSPKEGEIVECTPRLTELIRILESRRIVTVGKLPTEYLKGWSDREPDRWSYIQHPSFILRTGGKIGSQFQPWRHKLQEIVNTLRK